MSSKHIKPLPVVVVQPRHKPSFGIGLFAGKVIVGTAFTFLFALVAWWRGPIVFPDHYDLSYWQTFALLYLLRVIVPRPASFQYQSASSSAQPE